MFDHCQYWLVPPGALKGEVIKKATRILANFEEILTLEASCPGQNARHKHVHALGCRQVKAPEGTRSVSVAMSAGQYPAPLCASMAATTRLALVRRSLVPV